MTTLRPDVPLELFATERAHNLDECEDWCLCSDRPWFIAENHPEGRRLTQTFRTHKEAREWLAGIVKSTPLTERDFEIGRIEE